MEVEERKKRERLGDRQIRVIKKDNNNGCSKMICPILNTNYNPPNGFRETSFGFDVIVNPKEAKKKIFFGLGRV